MTDNQQRAADLYDALTDHHDPEKAIAAALDAAEERGRAEVTAKVEALAEELAQVPAGELMPVRYAADEIRAVLRGAA